MGQLRLRPALDRRGVAGIAHRPLPRMSRPALPPSVAAWSRFASSDRTLHGFLINRRAKERTYRMGPGTTPPGRIGFPPARTTSFVLLFEPSNDPLRALNVRMPLSDGPRILAIWAECLVPGTVTHRGDDHFLALIVELVRSQVHE